ncbi:MAG TPA: MFS transporter [Gemmatimonadaceae bacterium]|nr:MFS transporter [Gemmatimonadaceae bacterium]
MPAPLSDRFHAFRSGDFGKLAVLMATAFIDMVGALIIIPLLPFYATDLGASAALLGVLVAAFSGAQLLSAPLWGRVSDRYGRRPALLIGLGASAIAYVIFGFADSVWMLLISRLVQGAGGGTTGVIQAYVADSLEPRNRARGLGWLSAATNVGVVLGPLVGSRAAVLGGQHAPGLVAAGLCILNIIFAARFLTESHGADARKKARASSRSPYRLVWSTAVETPGTPAARCIWIYTLGIGAFYGVTFILTLFLQRRFNVDVGSIGYFYAYIGALNVIFRVGLIGAVVDRLGEIRTFRLGAVALSLGLIALPFTAHIVTLALAVALLPLGTALLFPSVTALLSQVVGDHERGTYMGVQQFYGGTARTFYPSLAGFAWDHLGVGVPFWASAAAVVATLFVGAGMERRVAAHRSAAAERAAKEEAAKEQAAVIE